MGKDSIHKRLDPENENISAGYGWPGNRLSSLDTQRLRYVANKTKRPVNQEAVVAYTTLMIAEIEKDSDMPPGRGAE